jgi:C-terminal processing protease CtpA/Prc
MVLGGDSAKEWVHIFRGAGYLSGVEVEMVSGDLDSSDHVSFLEKGVPAVQLFTGPHLDYHRPGDRADKIDVPGLVKVANLTKETLEYLAGREEPLTSQASDEAARSTGKPPSGGKRRSSLGTVPDFSFDGDGVRLTGVVPASAAEKAGLREGDIVVRVGVGEVHSLRDLSDLLKAHPPGTIVEVTFVRDREDHRVEVLLDER